MFKLKLIIFSLIIVFFSFFHFLDVQAKECNYPELGLKVVDGQVKEEDFDVLETAFDVLATSLYLVLPLKKENRTDVGEIIKEIGSADNCSKNVFACVYVEYSIEDDGVLKNVSDMFNGKKSFVEIKDSFSNLKFKQYNVLMNEEEFKKSNYYRVYKNGGNMISTSSVDALTDAFNTCSGGKDDGFSQFLGGTCSLVWGAVFENPLSVGNTVINLTRENKVYYSEIQCKKSMSDDPDAVDANCSQLEYLKNDYKSVISDYKSCADTECKIKKVDIMNSYDTKIKGICSSIMKSFNYDDFQSDCLNQCFSVNKDINDMKKGTDLYQDFSNSGTCGISDKIINWVSNIFKWVKYIAPVLVIILSMLDFIKAISTQNDDEVKKAQGRFVKRLISAALLFLIPFIIEFALDAFNLVSDYCDIV